MSVVSRAVPLLVLCLLAASRAQQVCASFTGAGRGPAGSGFTAPTNWGGPISGGHVNPRIVNDGLYCAYSGHSSPINGVGPTLITWAPLLGYNYPYDMQPVAGTVSRIGNGIRCQTDPQPLSSEPRFLRSPDSGYGWALEWMVMDRFPGADLTWGFNYLVHDNYLRRRQNFQFPHCSGPSTSCPVGLIQPGYVITNCGANTPTGTTCSATCAAGYSGTVTGTVRCTNGLFVGSFVGCAPTNPAWACTSAYVQAGYNFTNCGPNTPHNTICDAVRACAPGYVPTASEWTFFPHGGAAPWGEVKCFQGRYSCCLGGCDPACPAYTQAGYVVSGCPTDTRNGSSCSATCASGYSGSATGTVTCHGPSQSYSGSFSGCSLTPCGAYSQSGYTSSNCGTSASSGTTCTATCAPGYTGTPSGLVQCSQGVYSGSFSGCAVAATSAGPCPTAYTQTGYLVSGCPADTPALTSCSATCASGYTGTATGNVQCAGGLYSGQFSGCNLATYCNSAYAQTGYQISQCGTNTPSGTACVATCSTGYSGAVTGGVACSAAGTYSGAFAGCSPASCVAYTQPGYTTDCDANTPDQTSCSRVCAPGYVGNPTGAVTCNLGSYQGSFSGCVLDTAVSGTCTQTLTSSNGKFTATMTLNSTHLEVTMAGETLGWISWGFALTASMWSGDFWTGWVSGGNAYLYDTWSPDYSIPDLDAQQDLELLSYSESGGWTNMTFTRPIHTNENTEDLDIANKTVYFQYALHPQDGTSGTNYAEHTEYELLPGNFFSCGQVTAGVSYIGVVEAASLPDIPVSSPIGEVEDSNCKFKWEYTDQTDPNPTLRMEMSCKTTGYISFGFSETSAMHGDAIVAWVSGTSVGLLDQWMEDYYQPCNDELCGGSDSQPTTDRRRQLSAGGGAYDLIPLAASEVDGWTTVTFERKMTTGDEYDYQIVDEWIYLTYAFHDTDDASPYSYKEHTNWSRGFRVNLVTGQVDSQVFASLTAGQWLLCFSTGCLVCWAIFYWLGRLIFHGRSSEQEEPDYEMHRLSSLVHRKDPEAGGPLWDIAYDEDGEAYYYNRQTGESTYEPPAEDKSARRMLRRTQVLPSGLFDQIDLSRAEGDQTFMDRPSEPTKGKKTVGHKIAGVLQLRTVAKIGLAHWLLVLAFLALNALAGYLSARGGQPVSNILGSLCGACALLVMLPATRNSLLNILIGLPFDRAIKFHRWLGRYVVLLAVGHTIASVITWDMNLLYMLDTRAEPADIDYPLTGAVSLFGCVVLWLTSFSFCRRNHFELFFWVHHAFIIFFVAGAFHSSEFLVYAILAGCAWVIDKIFRNLQGAFPFKTTEFELKSDGLTRLRFGRTWLQRKLHPAGVGQYVFVNIPSVSLSEWHPFSITSGSCENDIEVCVRALGDWTGKLRDKAGHLAKHGVAVRIRVDGPYGRLKFSYFQHPRLLLIAGGIGVAPMIGLLKDILRVGLQKDSTRKKLKHHIDEVQLVWVIQSLSQLSWFEHELEQFQAGARKTRFQLEVHVTRPTDDERPRFPPFASEGRPDLDRVFADHSAATDSTAVVLVCGPSSMVNQCWSLTSQAKRSGKAYHFHSETFEF